MRIKSEREKELERTISAIKLQKNPKVIWTLAVPFKTRQQMLKGK